MKRILQTILISVVTLSPALVFGADFTLGRNSTFSDFINEILSIIDILKPILSALAFIFFFWGLSKFILHSGEQKTREEGKQWMIWSILVLFILLTYGAVVGLVSSELGIGNLVPNENNILLPTR